MYQMKRHHMKKLFRHSALIFCALAALLAYSTSSARQVVKWNFLKDSVYSELSAGDWETLKATTDEVLDKGADGTMQSWHNPETGANVVTTEYGDWATDCPEYKVTAVQITPATHRSKWQDEFAKRAEQQERLAETD